MNCRPPILLSNKPTFITRHAKQPQVSDPDAYFSLAGQIPDEIDGLAYDSSANVISFSEALSDTQELSVKLKVLYPSSDTEPFIEILQWKTGNTASWTPDTHQPVYKGAQS